MIRQLIIGSLFGAALGGVLTASIAHGVFVHEVAEPGVGGATPDTAVPGAGLEGGGTSSVAHPPLRPGSARLGLPPVPRPAPDLPLALDTRPTNDSPTV